MTLASFFSTLWLLFFLTTAATCFKVDKYSLLMPDVRPLENDAYLCTPIKVEKNKNYYITAFEPSASKDYVHHMLVYGCKSPGAKLSSWNCGEMANSIPGVKYASPCSEGSQIIYAWAMDAPRLELPDGVGFKVGGESQIKYLVLQVHYSNIARFADGSTDASGVYLHYTERSLDKLAGVILMGTGGVVPSHATEHMESSCRIKERTTIYPFAFRTHTHALGKVVTGYRVRNDARGRSQWTLLGRGDPQKPQMFYPIHDNIPIKQNDTIAARCTMVSNRSSPTQIGSTKNDEMCNFYLMYYVRSGEPLATKYCFTAGPPYYYWRKTEYINHIPDDASALVIGWRLTIMESISTKDEEETMANYLPNTCR